MRHLLVGLLLLGVGDAALADPPAAQAGDAPPATAPAAGSAQPATPAAAPAPASAPAPAAAPADAIAPAAAPAPAVTPADAIAPPPDPAAGERPDGRLDPPPRRRWRIVPRILLFPLHALFWAARFPTAAALRFEDRHHPLGRFLSWFTWNDGQRGLRPAFFFSTIYRPQFGLRYFDHVSLGVDTNLSISATTFGGRYVSSALSVEPTRVTARFRVTFDAIFDRRADLLFNGLGNHTYSNFPAARYLQNSLDLIVGLRLRLHPWLVLFGDVASGLKRFGNGDNIGGDPAFESVFNPALVQGFTHGTTFMRTSVGLRLDARDRVGRASTGVLAEVVFDYTFGIDGDRASYPRLRGAVGVPIDLWAHTHVLWLAAATAIAWNGDDAPVPFSELPTLGGPDNLRGFRFQDFRDYSSLYFTAEYRWPTAYWLDGAVFVDYGGVFGQNFSGFGTRQMQPDVGVALRLFSSRTFYVRTSIAYGFGEGVNFSISGRGP